MLKYWVLFLTILLLICFLWVGLKYLDNNIAKEDAVVKQHKKYIRHATKMAISKGNEPGKINRSAILVNDEGKILHAVATKLKSNYDLNQHAVMLLLAQIDTNNADLYKNSYLYLNVEPCPMCLGAVHQMSMFISNVVYGMSSKSISKVFYKEIANENKCVSSEKFLHFLGSKVKVEGPILEHEVEMANMLELDNSRQA